MRIGRILTIFSIAFLCGAPGTPVFGEIPLGNRSVLERDHAGNKDTGFLRSALRRVDRWAKEAKVKRPKVRMIFQSGQEKWEIIDSKEKRFILIPGNANDWERSFEMRQIIFGILFCARFSLPFPAKPEQLPLPAWITAAVDEAMNSKLSNEQYFSGNKDYLALQMIFKLKKQLPDFAALCKFDRPPADPAAREVFNQMSVLLMEIAAGHRLLENILSDYAARRSPDGWTGRFASSNELQIQLSDMAKDLLWNHRMPPPDGVLQERLDSLEKIVFPELDAKSIPTGKMLVLSFSEAHRLLLDNERPDLEEIRKYHARQWNQFSARQSPAVRQFSRELSDLFSELGKSGDAPERFEKTLFQLKKQLAHEREVMRWLIDQSFRRLPLDQLYKNSFLQLESSAGAASTSAVEKYLEDSEKKYLENY